MQATEAIEILRAALKQLGNGARNVAANAKIRGDNYDVGYALEMEKRCSEVLAATATIDPPAAPVLAAVGVEAQHQGNAIRPSAEPAGQLDAGIAAIFNEDRFRQLVLDVSNSSYVLGRHTDEDEKYAELMEVAERADSALIEYVLPFAMPEALEQSSTAGAAAGGNTTPEVTAAQPAADHACPRNTPYGPAVCGECVAAIPGEAK